MADPKGSTPEEGSYVPPAPVPSPLTPEQKKREDEKRFEMLGVKPEGRSLTEDSPFVPPGWTPDHWLNNDTELAKQENWRAFQQERRDFAQLSAEMLAKKEKKERIDYLAGLSLSERGMDMALEASKVAIPIVTEIAAPLGTAIVAAPLLAGGPPGIALYIAALAGSGFGGNALAQHMRIGYGQKEKFSWEESAAATAFSAIPGWGNTARMTAKGTMAFRAAQGSIMAAGEATTRQGLEMATGKRDPWDFNTTEIVFAATIGGTIGLGLGKLEVVLDIKSRAGETPEETVRRTFDEGVAHQEQLIKEAKSHAAKRDINEQERAFRNDEVKQRESILEEMVNKRDWFESRAGQLANEGQILEQAIKQIEKQRQQAGDNFESLAKDIETGYKPPVDGVDAPTVYHRGDRNQPNREEGLINLTDDIDAATNYALGGHMDEATHFSPEGVARLNEAKKNTKSYEVDAKNTLDLKNDPEAGAILKGLDAQGNKDAEKIIAYDNLYWWKNTQPHMQEAWKNIIIPQLKALGYDSIKYQDDLHETLAVFGGKQLKEINKQAEPTATISPSERAIPDELGKVTPERLERILKQFLKRDKGHEGGETGDTIASSVLPESDVSPKISKLTDDPELQDFYQMLYDQLGVEVVGTAAAKGKAKVPKDVVTAKEFIDKVTEEVIPFLDKDGVDAWRLLQEKPLTNKETGPQLEELGVRGAAYAALTSHGMRQVIKTLNSTDWETNPKALNDACVDIFELIAGPFMAYKRVTTAHGRNLATTKYPKDIMQADLTDAGAALEYNFLRDLKKSGALTPEAMQTQIDNFGEIGVIKKLLGALKQSQDLEEVAEILIRQQNAFQNKQTITRNTASGAELPSVYRRFSDVTQEMLYSSMLSSPITHWKAKIGNTFMQYYQPFQGWMGGKYMAHAPWARRGVSKQEWLGAAEFWKNTGLGYGIHNELAKQEAWRTFASGDSNIVSHFEKIGKSALTMDRTGLSGPLGQTLENVGKVVRIPGSHMQKIDMFSKQRVAHSMFSADTHRQFVKEHGRAPSELEFEAAWNVRKERVFTDELKIKNKDVVEREAVLASREQDIPAEELPEFIEKYVAKNWNEHDERFAEYVKRNTTEIAFQSTPGQDGAAASVIEKSLLKGEEFIKEFPFIGPELTATLFPFMRTGRNILSEGYSSGTAWMSAFPGTRRVADKLWAKTLADLDSPDPVIAARAKGKQIISAAVLLSAILAVKNGIFVGTERPEDWRLQENLETATGQRADEIRMVVTMDDVKHELGVDAAALEPLLTVAQVIANWDSNWHYLDKKAQNEMIIPFMSFAMANAEMLESKSYYANVGKLMKMFEAFRKEGNTRYMGRTTRSLFKAGVPSGVNALNTMTDNQRRSQDEKGLPGLMQVLANRFPGLSNQNPVYRDMFGDPVSRHAESPKDKSTKAAQLLSPINPLSWSIKRFDKDKYIKIDDKGYRRIDVSPVNLKNAEEVRNAAWAIVVELDIHGGFNGGTNILTSYSDDDGVSAPLNINLTRLKYEGEERTNGPKIGQDAFDRWLEIYSTFKSKEYGYLTLKEAIVLEGKHPRFTSTPTIQESQWKDRNIRMDTDPRKEAVMKIMRRYRKGALDQLVQEYPMIIKDAFDSIQKNAAWLEAGQAPSFSDTEDTDTEDTDTEELQQLLNN